MCALTEQGEITVTLDSSWAELRIQPDYKNMLWSEICHCDRNGVCKKASEIHQPWIHCQSPLLPFFFFFFLAQSQYYDVILLHVHPCISQIPFSFFLTNTREAAGMVLAAQAAFKMNEMGTLCYWWHQGGGLHQSDQTPEDLWALLSTKQNMRFYFKQLLMYISKGIDGKFELSSQLYCLSTHKNKSECQKNPLFSWTNQYW